MKSQFSDNYLLPHSFQVVGLIMALAGFISAFLRFVAGIKPEFLDVKVFAVHSSYFDTKTFTVIGNNISEEICAFLLLTGFFLLTVSAEKTEKEEWGPLRLKSFLVSVYVSTLLLCLSVIFIFGMGFIGVLSVNLFLLLLIYNLYFHYSLYKLKKKLSV